MNVDNGIKTGTFGAVGAVASFAAVISYSHIDSLARSHGQTALASLLLPLSVDGLIAAASMVALYAARNDLPVPGLARLMLGAGILATISANVAYGLPYGIIGGIISAWPAAALIGTVELALWLVRASAEKPAAKLQPVSPIQVARHVVANGSR